MQLFRGLTPLLYTQDRDQDWMKDIDARAQFAIDFGKKNRFVKFFFVVFWNICFGWIIEQYQCVPQYQGVPHHVLLSSKLGFCVYVENKLRNQPLADMSQIFIDEIGRALGNFVVWLNILNRVSCFFLDYMIMQNCFRLIKNSCGNYARFDKN